ncbi:hypothetical protein [Saccharothrix variisporea]|uniref:Uncharacterized protein n=1 Tax=Saccharothrix variisporea TaxID=543527 RepID=A0A495XCX8_9PSEU|nr:hypothetical protein [Saccharothrix variisporea]RKT69388.1 hypothetical protein DFJ66_2608 [Saccharothrix variisporea]
MTASKPNYVSYNEIRAGVIARLDRVSDIAEDGEDEAVICVAREEVPALLAGTRALISLHRPDDQGRCRACRGGRWWRRRPVPCRPLLEFQLAVHTASTGRGRHHRR